MTTTHDDFPADTHERPKPQLFDNLSDTVLIGEEKLEDTLSRTDLLKNRLENLRPLHPETITSLREWYDVRLTYTSNAIEGNTLDERETAMVLQYGLTSGNKPLKDYEEAVDHKNALDFVYEIASRPEKTISEQDVLNIHGLVMQKTGGEAAGKYRDGQVVIGGTDLRLPTPNEVPQYMNEFFEWLENTRSTDMHPVSLAAEAHYRLVRIHPFADGNGRTARLLMNLILTQEGFPPAVIDPEKKATYIQKLDQVDTTNMIGSFKALVASSVNRSLNRYIATAQKSSK
jgi:Fic family protein